MVGLTITQAPPVDRKTLAPYYYANKKKTPAATPPVTPPTAPSAPSTNGMSVTGGQRGLAQSSAPTPAVQPGQTALNTQQRDPVTPSNVQRTPTGNNFVDPGVTYTGPSEGDYANIDQFSDSQLRDIQLYGANAATEEERRAIKARADEILASRRPTVATPEFNGMGGDGRQLGADILAPAQNASVTEDYITENVDGIRVGTTNPNIDGPTGDGSAPDQNGMAPDGGQRSPTGGNRGLDQSGAPGGPGAGPGGQPGPEGLQDTSVQRRLLGILDENSELMQQARTRGLQQANGRGLLNSSMGVQAAEAAVLDVALPIASQEASQAHEVNLQLRGIFSDEKLQDAQIAAQKEMQGEELSSRERIALSEVTAAMERLEAQISADAASQGREISAQERLQTERLTVEQQIQQLDREAQERISNVQVAAGERQNAAGMAVNIENSYTNMVSTVMNNPDIPAATRQQYLDHAAQVRDSNYALLEQIYQVDLQWTTPGGTPTPTNPTIPGFGGF